VNWESIKESISAVPEIPMVAEIAEIFSCCVTAAGQSAPKNAKPQAHVPGEPTTEPVCLLIMRFCIGVRLRT